MQVDRKTEHKTAKCVCVCGEGRGGGAEGVAEEDKARESMDMEIPFLNAQHLN